MSDITIEPDGGESLEIVCKQAEKIVDMLVSRAADYTTVTIIFNGTKIRCPLSLAHAYTTIWELRRQLEAALAEAAK